MFWLGLRLAQTKTGSGKPARSAIQYNIVLVWATIRIVVLVCL